MPAARADARGPGKVRRAAPDRRLVQGVIVDLLVHALCLSRPAVPGRPPVLGWPAPSSPPATLPALLAGVLLSGGLAPTPSATKYLHKNMVLTSMLEEMMGSGPRILIAGGGCGGMHTALRLERLLRPA